MTDFLLLKHDVPLRFGTHSEAPQSPQNGMIYYDTTLNLFRVYENGQWQALSSRDYAKNSIASFDVKESCEVASTGNISATYANGTSGVGATLTGAGALGTIDGVTLSVGQRVLVLAQSAAEENGVYKVTALNPFVLTRAVDFDESEEVNGGEFVFVKNGTNYGNCSFVCTNSAATIGTTAIVFTQISGNARTLQQYYATGNQIDTASGRNVIVAGTEKLEVTSAGGVEITGALSAGETLLSTVSVPEVMSVGSNKLAVNLNGNITKLNSVAVSFPSSASMSNYALANNGSGSLSFSSLSVQNMNDVTLTSVSNGDYLQYTSSGNWLNKFALETGNRSVVIATSSSIPIGVNSPWAGDNAILNYGNNANFVQCQSISNASGYLESIDYWIQRLGNFTSSGTIHACIMEYLGGGSSVLANGVPPSQLLTPPPKIENALAVSAPFDVTTIPSGYSSNPSKYRFYFTGSNQIQLNPAKTYLIWLIKSTGLEYVADLYNETTFSVHYTLLSDNPYANGKMITFAFQRQYDYKISSAIWFDPARIGAGTTTYPNYDIKMQINTLSATKNSSMYSGVFRTNASGLLDNFFLESNLNLKNNVISGISNPSVSTDLANKAYVDAAATLQALYNQDPNGSGATITTTSTDGALIIAGSEKLQVTASSGISVSQILSVSSSMTTGTLAVGAAGALTVSSGGNPTNIKGLTYNFPAVQASGENLILFSDASGNLTWSDPQLAKAYVLTSASNQDLLRYSGSNWTNQSSLSSFEAPTLSDPTIISSTASTGSGYAQTDTIYIAGQVFTLTGAKTLTRIDVRSVGGYPHPKYVPVSYLVRIYSGDLRSGGATLVYSTTVYITNPDALASLAMQFPLSYQAAAGTYTVTFYTPESGSYGNLQKLNTGTGGVQSQNSGVSYQSTTDLVHTLWGQEAQGGNSRVIQTNGSGLIDQTFLQYNMKFGDNIISDIGAAVGSSDVVTKAQVDGQTIDPSAGIVSLTLQKLYDQDSDLYANTIITTTSEIGGLDITGTADFKVSAAQGFLLASSTSDTKFTKLIYKHGLTLSANQTDTALSAFTFSSSVYQGCVIEYRIKDEDGRSRIGTLLVSTDGIDTAVSDTFAETSPVGVSWEAELSGVNVEIKYTTDSTTKTMSAAIKYFL